MNDVPRKPTRFRWLLRFSLRSLFLVLTIGCLACGWLVNRIRQERAAIAWADKNGAYMSGRTNSDWQSRIDETFKIHPIACLELSERSAIDDIGPIAHLRGLERLGLYHLPVHDIRALYRQTQLRQLSLAKTQVTDLSPLVRLHQLVYLDLQETPVSDLSPLAKLSSLTDINLNQTRVSDLRTKRPITSLNLAA